MKLLTPEAQTLCSHLIVMSATSTWIANLRAKRSEKMFPVRGWEVNLRKDDRLFWIAKPSEHLFQGV
jgi:hypothetical protein